jgi:hypothetical protein
MVTTIPTTIPAKKIPPNRRFDDRPTNFRLNAASSFMVNNQDEQGKTSAIEKPE